jgi:hypothetical protein
MLNKNQKIIIATVALTTFTTSVAAWCPPPYFNEMVAPAFLSASSSIVAAVTAVDAALGVQLQMNSQRLTSAIAILTKQKAIAANQMADATRVSSKVTAQAISTIEQSQRVKESRFNYGAEFGQGYNPCKVSASRTILHKSLDDANQQSINDVNSEVIANPGAYGLRSDIAAQQTKKYQESYCTKDQVNAGLCSKVGDMSGKSINIASIFETSAYKSKQHEAKVDFINNIVGLPDNNLPLADSKDNISSAKNAANNNIGLNYTQLKQEKDAAVSPAIYSFKKIQNDYVEKKGAGSAVSTMFNNETERYMGVGNEGQNWSKNIATQNQRGLMLEMLKMKALDLAIQARQYEQQERIEANLAVLVSTAANNNLGSSK